LSKVEEIWDVLKLCSPEERNQVFQLLRAESLIHPLEKIWNVNAERILEAVSRSPDLTKRGVRGVIAEATFVLDVVPHLSNWECVPIAGDLPYDCLLRDRTDEIRIQIKNQRLEAQVPKLAHKMKAYGSLPENYFIVETQKTRGGTSKDGGKTRPYRFGEFDILGVCLHPSTNNWNDFVYTVANWLIPSSSDTSCLATYQPVSPTESDDWTRDLLKCISWLRAGNKKLIGSSFLNPEGNN